MIISVELYVAVYKSKKRLVIGQQLFTHYSCESFFPSFQVMLNYKSVKTYFTGYGDFQFKVLLELCTPVRDISSGKQFIDPCIAANKVAQFSHNLKYG